MRATEHTTAFDEVREREGELTDRQRQALDLIVAGKTNAEIAGTLGITLSGAKWHVSEILTKLGLATREEAADYWRWRKRPSQFAGRAMRGLLALPALKWAAGAFGVAAIGVAAVFVLLRSGAEPANAGVVEPFYLEARVSVSIHGDPADPKDPFSRERETTLQWWYADGTRHRVEWRTELPLAEAGSHEVWMADGTDAWTYSTFANTYARRTLPPDGEWAGLAGGAGILLGPIPPAAGGIERLLEMVVESSNGNVRMVGEEEFLGRKTTIYEYGPGWSAETVSGEVHGGMSRVWYDPETEMILAMETGEPRSLRAEVTVLDNDQVAPGDTYVFTPPPGSRERVEIRGNGSPPPQSGFLEVMPLPGWVERGISWHTESGEPPSNESQFGRDDTTTDGAVLIRQQLRLDGVPAAPASWAAFTSPGGVNGHRTTSSDGQYELFWSVGDIAVHVLARHVDETTLMAYVDAVATTPTP